MEKVIAHLYLGGSQDKAIVHELLHFLSRYYIYNDNCQNDPFFKYLIYGHQTTNVPVFLMFFISKL